MKAELLQVQAMANEYKFQIKLGTPCSGFHPGILKWGGPESFDLRLKETVPLLTSYMGRKTVSVIANSFLLP